MAALSNVNDGKGSLLTCACSQVSNSTAGGRLFNSQYAKKFHAAPGAYSPESFDATNMVLTAMTKIKKVTRANITAELKKLTYKGLTKVIKFNSAGDVTSNSVAVYQVQVGSGSSSSIKEIATTTP